MTVFEKIKTLTAEEFTDFLMGYDNHLDTIGHIYCSTVCENRTDAGECEYPDNEEPPCLNLTAEEMTIAWLNQDFNER